MAYWLMKSEPLTWSWDMQVAAGTTSWDGVRNFQAANNMKKMKIGDQAFFYHSGKDREIVGIVRITRTYYPDHTDPSGRFGMVDVETVKTLPHPISLATIKARDALNHIALVRQSRLSVMPIDEASWHLLLSLSPST